MTRVHIQNCSDISKSLFYFDPNFTNNIIHFCCYCYKAVGIDNQISDFVYKIL